ncbi:MAG: MFS transporter, partial [Rhodocyclaceae bacterium]|nr:MFS transporter [Rhodocyclaceae bacterium]
MSPSALLWLIVGCLMLQPLSTDLYLASLPHLATDFGVTPAAVQQTLSLFVIGFGVAQLISGPLSDRFGR